MKKSNIITLLSFVILIVVIILFMFVWRTPSESSDTDTGDNLTQDDIEIEPSSSDTDLPEDENLDEDPTTENNPSESDNIPPEVKTISMDDALFIGDSRTVGLMEYAQIEGADFFANVGMSVYNIHDDSVSVPDLGDVTLTELLNTKDYGKIYIMLGINEVGYDFNSTVAKYSELIDFIKEKQPNAIVIIQANLHVTKSRSDSDDVVNNIAINELNTKISKLSDGKSILYLDANVIFDDEFGNLSSDKTGDNSHLYAKHYSEWGNWITEQTAALIG